ncbi:urease accessory protein UreE [Bizionia saleffrena]|uniref:Urease accessory protein UreE n=1 Tax=Bizionia saleffrena TaxID=291189 RepID=A0A8H2LHR1_9FLAO|nr:urease accessory protein UreE [Bizionia saleffrena]TYB76141.1 urease accessory protein UreE [Bizionia saleffrena]
MLCKEVIGNIKTYSVGNKTIDTLSLEWFEMTKRIMRKKTEGGREVAIKFLKEGQRLHQGDIVLEDDNNVVIVDVLPCDSIQVTPRNIVEMGTVCYEIGNKHLPIFIQDEKVLVPYEKPLERLLEVTGYIVEKKHCQLLNMLKANIGHAHGNGNDSPSLFSRILDLTTKQ